MIKRILPTIILLLSLNLILSAQVVSDSVSMNTGYVNDVFYSLKNGEVQNSDRSSWDIAFSTNIMSAAILSNKGAGVQIFEYPGDTTEWASIDTTGLSTWPEIFNSDTTWEEGAFNHNSSGDFNYGWGIYNMLDHNVYGNKIYIVKLADGSMKKLWIKMKYSLLRTYDFAFSDIDNSNEELITLDCSPYADKNFLSYSLANNQIIDYEPASSSWDIVFTRYQDLVIPYFVTGALINYNTRAAMVNTSDHSITDTTGAGFTEDIAIIGSEWKEFNMGTFSYDVLGDMVFFVETAQSEVYRLVFTGFDGTSTGNIYFDKELIFTNSIFENDATNFDMKLFPNPANNQINIVYSLPQTTQNVYLKIVDLAGRITYSKSYANESKIITIDNLELSPGTYIVELSSENYVSREKLIIE